MKNLKQQIQFASALLIAGALMFSSCDEKKNTDEETDSPSTEFRVKKITNFDNGAKESEYEVIYDGGKVIQILGKDDDGNGNLQESFKMDISYSGDNATVIWYYKDSAGWLEESKSDYIIKNDKITQELSSYYENGSWHESWKWTYTYDGNNLKEWASYDNDGGSLVQEGRGEYIYQDGKLVEVKGYWKYEDALVLDDKEVLSYNGSQLTGFTDYDIDYTTSVQTENYKAEYIYSGDQLSQADYSYWDIDANDWTQENMWHRSYTYDANGYLVDETYTETDYLGKEAYEYESGSGNISLFYYYPEDMVYGEPMLKSNVRKCMFRPYSEQFRNQFKR